MLHATDRENLIYKIFIVPKKNHFQSNVDMKLLIPSVHQDMRSLILYLGGQR